MQLATGTYTGDGNDDRWINAPGFEPDLVIVARETSDYIVFKTSDMGAIDTQRFASISGERVNRIQAFGANGFQVGTDNEVNTDTIEYHWVAVKDNGADDFAVGTYTGNGGDGRSLTGVGFQPDFACIKREDSEGGVWRTSSHVGDDTANFFALPNGSNSIQSFLSDGFELGDSSLVNNNGSTYYYFAFKDVPGMFETGTYTGDGNDDRDITVGFAADSVWINPDRYNYCVFRTDTFSGDKSTYFVSDTISPETNHIQSLDATSFQVGDENAVNANGSTYYWAAWQSGTTLGPSASDSVSVAESTDLDIARNLGVSDAVAVAESAEAVPEFNFAGASDAAIVSESITVTVEDGDRSLSIPDTIGLSEYLAAPLITVTDNIGIAEGDEQVTGALYPITDTVSLADAMNRVITDGISLSEAVSITASLTIADTIGLAEVVSVSGPTPGTPGTIATGALGAKHVIKLLYGDDPRNPTRTLSLADSAPGNIYLRTTGHRFGSGQRQILWSGRSVRFDGQKKLAESRDNATIAVMYDLSSDSGAGLAHFQRKVNQFFQEAKAYEERSHGERVWLEYRWSDNLGTLPTPTFGGLSNYYRVLAGTIPQWPDNIHEGGVVAGEFENVALELICEPAPQGLEQQVGIAEGDVTITDDGTLVGSGSSSLLHYTSYTNSGLTGNFTVTGWITCDWGSPPAGDAPMFDYFYDASNRIQLVWDGANDYWTITKTVGGTPFTDDSGVQSISDGDSVHLALVQDDTTLYLFADGAEVASVVATNTMTDGGTIALGCAGTGSPDGSDVALDGWRIFGEELSSDQVDAIYDAELPVKTAGGSVGAAPFLYTSGGSGQVGNKDDTTHDFWSIVGGVAGDLPARARIHITPAAAGETSLHYFWLASRAYGAALSDTETFYLANFTGEADANSCYAEYLSQTPGADTDHSTTLTSSSLSDMKKLQGKFEMLCRLKVSSGTFTITPWWYFGDVDTKITGTAQSLTASTYFKLLDLGEFTIDWPVEDQPGQRVTYGVTMSGTGTYFIDYIYMLPAPRAKATQTGDTTTIADTDDVIVYRDGMTWVNSANRIRHSCALIGDEITFEPGKYNYLWCIQANDDRIRGTWVKTLKIYVTPRYLLPGGMVA